MSTEAKPYTSEDLRHRAVTDAVLTSRLRATVEALERVTKERDEARGYRDQWMRAAEVERGRVRAEFEAWKTNHLNHEADDLRAERDAALAACAELRAALEMHPGREQCCRPDMSDGMVRHDDGCRVLRALSSTAGRGWVSPSEHARVVLERDQAQMDYANLRELIATMNAKRGEQ